MFVFCILFQLLLFSANNILRNTILFVSSL